MLLEERKLVYLASPYTHPDAKVRQERFKAVCVAQGQLLLKGYFVYSPIVATEAVLLYNDLPFRFGFWRELDELMISKCDYLVVLKLDGWEQSVGVKHEVEFAKLAGLGIFYSDPSTLEGLPNA